MAEVAGGTLNSSAANFKTAVKGVASGTLSTLKGSFGSEVKVILKVTLDAAAIVLVKYYLVNRKVYVWNLRDAFKIYKIGQI